MASFHYGSKVRYQAHERLELPDFSLEFTGTHRVETRPHYPHGFLYYDFVVATPGQRQEVHWSSGTGEIAPKRFDVAGTTYELELQLSNRLGRLNEGELVVWKVEPNGQRKP